MKYIVFSLAKAQEEFQALQGLLLTKPRAWQLKWGYPNSWMVYSGTSCKLPSINE